MDPYILIHQSHLDAVVFSLFCFWHYLEYVVVSYQLNDASVTDASPTPPTIGIKEATTQGVGIYISIKTQYQSYKPIDNELKIEAIKWYNWIPMVDYTWIPSHLYSCKFWNLAMQAIIPAEFTIPPKKKTADNIHTLKNYKRCAAYRKILW